MRFRQRGFSNVLLNIVESCGRIEKAPGGAIKIFFGKKEASILVQEAKSLIQLMDKANGSTLIVKGNELITMYKQ